MIREASPAGDEPPKPRRFSAELAQTLDALLFASPSHRTRERVADGLATLSRPQQDVVLHWAGVIAQNNPELAWQVCARAPKIFARSEGLSAAQFAAWVQAVLAQTDQALGAPGWLDDVEGFLARHADASGLSLEGAARRLGLFMQGISGASPAIQPLATGERRAWTDGETLFLPTELGGQENLEAAHRHYRRLAVLLWAQTRHGSLDPAHDQVLAQMPQSARARGWYEVLESERLRARLVRDFPGMSGVLPTTPSLPEHIAAALQVDGASVADTLCLLPQLLATGDAPPALPTRIDFSAVAARLAQAGTTSAPSSRRLPSVFRAQGRHARAGEQSGQALDTGMAGDADDGAAGVEAGRSDEPPVAVATVNTPPPPGGTLMPAGSGRWRASQAGESVDGMADELAAEAIAPWRYDEWDFRRMAYRRQWCHVFEHPGAIGELAWVEEVSRRHARAIRQIRRRFESLRGEERWQRHQSEGSEIDLDAWVDALADVRSGSEIDPRLFSQRQRQERSLAVIFMVDMSGSTKGWVNEAVRESLVMLCEAIEMLGDRYAIYGFSGWTHKRCDIYRIKDFAEPYAEAVKARIAGIEACDYTRMGPAIRHLSALLATRPERHKLLVSLSDGRPDDFGDDYRGRYGIEDTRRALHEAQRAGIRRYCVTVDRHAADYLPQLYGTAHYSVLADAKALPLRIAQVYRRLVS